MSFCVAATIINVYAKHQYSNVCSDSFFLGRQWHGDTGVLCVYWESHREEREGESERGPLGGIDPSFSSFVHYSPVSTAPLLSCITLPQLMSNKLDSIVLFTPQSDCPRKCINAYYVEWRLCGLLQHIGAAVSTRDRTGCDGVMLCTGSVQVYTNFQRSSSPARSPHIWSWVCSLSSRWSPLSLSLSLVHRIYPSTQDTKAVAICEINKMI